MYKKRLQLLILLLIPFSVKAQPDNSTTRPNIVFILADDLGWSDTGCYGAEFYKTPAIDALAESGMRFTNAYANSPNCAPSRAAIVSGQYCGRTGMYNVGYSARGLAKHRSVITPTNSGSLPLDKVTIGDAMVQAGYSTSYFGKWHLGDYGGYHFNKRGFEEGFQINKPTKNGFWKIDPYPSLQAIESESGIAYKAGETYLGDFITDNAVAYIDRHAADTKPFFMMVGQFLIHAPLQAPKKTIAAAKKESKVNPDNPEDHNVVLAAMTKELDRCVAKIRKKLKEKNILDNTLIVFMSDNGGVGGYSSAGIKGAEDYTGNWPLNGGKTNLYEGGVRVPLIVSWPGTISAGKVSGELLSGLDLYPTLLDLAGVAPTDFVKSNKYTLDGASAKEHWLSQKPIEREHPLVFHFPAYASAWKAKNEGAWRSTPMAAINNGTYKLVIHHPSKKKELYRLDEDISEKRDLSAAKPEVVDDLYRAYEDWIKRTGAKLPVRRDAKGVNWQGRIYQENSPALSKILLHPAAGEGVVLVDFEGGDQNMKKTVFNEILLELNGSKISSLNDLRKVVSNLTPSQTIDYTYSFGGRVKTRKIKVKSNVVLDEVFDFNKATDMTSPYSGQLSAGD